MSSNNRGGVIYRRSS